MQIPNLRPVFVREQANKMYSSSAYFLAGWLSSTLTLLIYPVLGASISFWFLAFYDNSAENFFRWLGVLVVLALQGSSYGFMFGCILENEEAGINWLQYSDMVFLFGSGFYVNLKTANWFIKFLGYISPFRYTIEPLLRIMLRGLDFPNDADTVCDYYDFNFKDKAVPIALGLAVGFFLLAWFVIVIKAKYYM